MPPSGSHAWQKQLCCSLIQEDWLICALSQKSNNWTTILLSTLINSIQQILQKRQTQGKLKHSLKNNNPYRSLNGGRKMFWGVFPFMLQLLVYLRKEYKNYSSLFSAFEYKLQGATRGDCIHWICNFVVLFQHQKMSEL